MRYDAGAAAYDELAGQWTRLYAGAALAACGAKPGDRLLDLATGTGVAALLARETMGTNGTVVGVDLSVPMLQVAAEKIGSANISLVAADALQLPFAERSFEGAICLFGLMFFPQPVLALRDLRRVLAPGSRVAFMTWSTPERAAFAGFMAQALVTELPADRDEVLKPFSFSDPNRARSYLKEAGFDRIETTTLSRPIQFASAEAYLRPYERGGGRLGQFYLGLDPQARDRVNALVRTKLAPFADSGSFRIQIDALMTMAVA